MHYAHQPRSGIPGGLLFILDLVPNMSSPLPGHNPCTHWILSVSIRYTTALIKSGTDLIRSIFDKVCRRGWSESQGESSVCQFGHASNVNRQADA